MKKENNYIDWPVVNGREITVQVLKDEGFSVVTNSFRQVSMPYVINGQGIMIPVDMPVYEIRRRNLQGLMLPKGGYTTIKVTQGKVCVIGEGKCHPNDHFNKDFGIKIAMKDVVNQLLSVKKV
jgi:hypothetical protein